MSLYTGQSWEWCAKHQALRIGGEPCNKCVEETTASDLFAENRDLRFQVNGLAHRCAALEQRYEQLANDMIELVVRLEALAAHVTPDPWLLS